MPTIKAGDIGAYGPCQTCGAEAGKRCRASTGTRLTQYVHKGRRAGLWARVKALLNK